MGEDEALRAQLEATRRVTAKVLRHVEDVVTLATADGAIIGGSGDVKGFVGYPPGYLRNHPLIELVHPADQARAAALRERMLAAPGEEVRETVQVRAADGSWADVELLLVNLLEDPDVRSVVATTRDVTVQKRHERELAAARDLAVAQADDRTRLMAAVSHELRTPLHAALGVTEALLSTSLDADQRELVTLALAEGERLRGLVDDLLDLSHIDAGDFELTPSPFDPRAAVLAEVESVGPPIQVSSRVDDAVPPAVSADRRRFGQVVRALIEVATTRPGGGQVSVAVEPRPTRSPGLLVRAVVSGGSMSDDEVRALFDPLHVRQTGGDELGWRSGGVGLRVALARRIALLMGGDVAVETVGDGMALTFTCSAAPASVPVRRAGRRGPGRGRRVLVVDDSATNRMVASTQLTRLGYVPIEAETGEAALDVLAEEPIDLVLMDWQLPGIDGLEATRRLRSSEADDDHIPVIAVTASVRPGDDARCRAAGMDALLAKPMMLADLDAELSRWVGGDDAPVPSAADPVGPVDRDVRIDPLVDPEALTAAAEDLGDRDVVVTLVEVFLEELPGRTEALVGALRAADGAHAGRAAHALRGPCLLLGATRLAAWCEALPDEVVDDGGRLADEAESLCAATGAAFAAHLERTDPSAR